MDEVAQLDFFNLNLIYYKILPFMKEEDENNEPGPINVIIQAVGQYFLMFILIANFSYYNSSILEVKIVEPLSNLKKYFGFNWTAVNYTDTYIELQIKFENPLYISSGSLTEPDKLSV